MDMTKETLKESAVNTVRRVIAAGKYALEEIVNISGLSSSDEERQIKMHKLHYRLGI